jgi:acyl-CoA dehydrogenase
MSLTSLELADFTGVCRRFIRERVWPIEQRVDDEEHVDRDIWLALIKESVELGLYTVNVPESLGGPGLTIAEQNALWEEFGHTSWPFTYLLARAHPVLFQCTPRQRVDYLDRVLRGEREPCFALTESGAGSDNSAMKTRAEQVPGGYRISGTKHFISHGDADFAIVFAVTGPPLRGRTPQITAFLVDRDTPGFTVGRAQRMMGWNGMHEHELVFEQCLVPDSQVLGEPGQGLRLALASVGQRRLQVASYCIGAMDRLIALTSTYASDRVLFDSALADKQGIQWMLADMAVDAHVAREATRRAATLCDAARSEGASDVDISHRFRSEISIAKLYASRALNRVADIAVQVHGGMGWARESPVERLYRDARVFRIVEGADEVHRTIIARSVLAARA